MSSYLESKRRGEIEGKCELGEYGDDPEPMGGQIMLPFRALCAFSSFFVLILFVYCPKNGSAGPWR
jgi:hypothetical protein